MATSTVQINVRLSEPLRKALEERAWQDHNSLNAVITKAIEAYLQTARASS